MAWIVKNILRGTLTFKGVGISIPAKGELDLDAELGRDRAETSNQVLVAFEEGYLRTIAKDEPGAAQGGSRGDAQVLAHEAADRAIGARMDSLRSSFQQDLVDLRSSLAGDVRGMIDGLKLARAKIREEKDRLVEDRSLSEAEIRARLATLDEEERRLEKNFTDLGRKRTSEDGSAAEKADLLANM